MVCLTCAGASVCDVPVLGSVGMKEKCRIVRLNGSRRFLVFFCCTPSTKLDFYFFSFFLRKLITKRVHSCVVGAILFFGFFFFFCSAIDVTF